MVAAFWLVEFLVRDFDAADCRALCALGLAALVLLWL